MGWGSAGNIFDPVARALVDAGVPEEQQEEVLTQVIRTLQEQDWDTEYDSLQDFRDKPGVVKAFANCGIHWDDLS
ncbi:hypothetical protein [Streptomyces virginiae]|uniref:hypothetical protein n=1 Tax=Streptomyces virginiae TaxID=1961 RepID=UPI00365E8D03